MRSINWKELLKIREFRIFALFVLVALFPINAGTETITMKTWYPSPYGSYQRFRVANGSDLAADGGHITVGRNATASLVVNGDISQSAGDSWFAQSSGSQMVLGTETSATQTRLNVYGNAVVNDIWLKNANGGSGGWLSQMLGIKSVAMRETVYYSGHCYSGTVTASCPSGYKLLSCSASVGDMHEDDEASKLIPDMTNNTCSLYSGKACGDSDTQYPRVFAFCYAAF